MKAAFARWIGVDYSGAATPETALTGLRVYVCEGVPVQAGRGRSARGRASPAREVRPDPMRPARHWSRRGLADWLLAELSRPEPTLVGIDHALGFPLTGPNAPPEIPAGASANEQTSRAWGRVLEMFCARWATDAPGRRVDDVRRTLTPGGRGDPRSRRLCERQASTRGAKSVYHFDVPGSVAKSTHAGLPWVAMLRRELGPRLHVWPFDGWSPPSGAHVLCEVYPRLWARASGPTPRGLTQDQRDARAVALALRRADHAGELDAWLNPALAPSKQATARIEGWILGVEGAALSARGS